MHSQNYTLDDLILDPDFIKWVKDENLDNQNKWASWASSNAANADLVSEARDLILELSTDGDTPLQTELTEVWERILASNEAYDSQRKPGKLRHLVSSWYSVAAVSAAILIVSILAAVLLNNEVEYQTAFGQNKTIVLPDNSVVVLNANSSITYSPEWDSEKPREIWLEGEGFFSVTHKKNSQKFVVHTNDLDVQVLGTKFNVNTRRSKTQVVLNSGKVKLYLADENKKEVDMKPGELVDFSASDKAVVKKAVVVSKYNAWLDKKLVFEEAPLSEVALTLEENFGYKVKFSNPELADLTFTGTVESGNVNLLLKILQRTFNISITKKEETITISKK